MLYIMSYVGYSTSTSVWDLPAADGGLGSDVRGAPPPSAMSRLAEASGVPEFGLNTALNRE